MKSMQRLIEQIYQDLFPQTWIKSINPHDPVQVDNIPQPWELVGAGNYAAVFSHPDYPDLVVKIYAPGRPGWAEEVEVYRRLGSHPAFSECYYSDENFLILKRLYGITLYDCLALGLLIPEQVIQDIDQALEDACDRGLFPHDVHGRNVMMHEGRGLVVDISDFLQREPCHKWQDLKKAYYRFYRPLFYLLRLRIPYFVLNFVRKGYRLFRRLVPRSKRTQHYSNPFN